MSGDVAIGVDVGPEAGVALLVDVDAEVVEALDGSGAHLGEVLADAAGERQHVDSAEHSCHGADLTSQAVEVGVKCQAGAGLTVVDASQHVTHAAVAA